MEEEYLRKILLVISCCILTVGQCGGPLITRLYFVKGGKSVWFSGWLETGGWPLIFIPLLISYLYRRRTATNAAAAKPVLMTSPVFIGSAAIGLLTGANKYIYAYGIAMLPVFTSAIVAATQLGFTALFAFFLVRQKFTAYSLNAIVLLTLSSGVLAAPTSGDREEGETREMYFVGFMVALAAAALDGLILPLVERVSMKAIQGVTYTLVMEIQLVMCFFATSFSTVGMLVNHEFKAIPREAKAYELGETSYYLVVTWSAVIWQCYYLGAIGVISCSSSLLSGIMIAVLLPITEVLAVIFFSEKFGAEKRVALVLSLWGLISYFYGEIIHNKEKKKSEREVTEDENPLHNQLLWR